MEKPLVEVCAEVVAAQLQGQTMTTGEITESIRTIHGTLHALHAPDSQNAVEYKDKQNTLVALRRNPRQSLQKTRVTCLECGKQFMLLSNRHLNLHDLTPRAYKEKWRIPLTTSLSARTLTARRRKLAKEMEMGKGLAAWRAARNKALA